MANLTVEHAEKLRRLATACRDTAKLIFSGELVPERWNCWTRSGPGCAFGQALAAAGFAPEPGATYGCNTTALAVYLGVSMTCVHGMPLLRSHVERVARENDDGQIETEPECRGRVADALDAVALECEAEAQQIERGRAALPNTTSTNQHTESQQ